MKGEGGVSKGGRLQMAYTRNHFCLLPLPSNEVFGVLESETVLANSWSRALLFLA
jgi:hypothetical protein